MKNVNLVFKRVGLLSITYILFCSCFEMTESISLKDKNAPKSEESLQIMPPTNQMILFFTNRLAGNLVPYNDESTFPLSQMENERVRVWVAWKSANNKFQEQKLIPLEDLKNKRSGRWNLPQKLEPNAIMPYYFGSKGVAPATGYPFFIYMHGSGQKNGEWETGYNLCKSFNDAPSIYFIPQIPNEGNYYRWWQKAKQFAWEKLFRLTFLTDSVDPNRIYLFGISEGGYGSQRLASFYADYIAGAGPMAGGEPIINAPADNCRNIAFSLQTGANDNGFCRNTITQITKEIYEELHNKYQDSYINRIELVPGMGHAFDYSHTTPWLRQHVRNPYPMVVSWENFEMDGVYRKGFYNIVVNERSNPNDQSRTRYEMKINNNNISLRVDNITYHSIENDPIWGIGLKYVKRFLPAITGKVTIYLCSQLVDLSREVVLTVNRREVFRGILPLTRKNLMNSCAIFADPARLYPAAIEVDLSK